MKPSEHSSRSKSFLHFCASALGSDKDAPLKDCNGALAGALVEAFRRVCNPVEKEHRDRKLQDFEDPIFSEPWVCYSIRNMGTGRVDIGRASKGFLDRYPNGEWWSVTTTSAWSETSRRTVS